VSGYVRALSAELARLGVPRKQRQRILMEIEDHLACDPWADLGPAGTLAEEFANDLGTRAAKRAAFVSFAALAIAGLFFAVVFMTSGFAGPNATRVYASSAFLGYLGVLLVLLAPQLAFVAGGLAALRAFRNRRQQVIARSDATVLGRRAAVGLAAGVATMAGLALVSLEFEGRLAGWWTTLALSAAAVGGCALAIATPTVLLALRVRPAAAGRAGDLFHDLAGAVPARLRGRPWALAASVSGLLALLFACAGIVLDDPIDGALRGGAEALACLLGFALLGPYLGLRTGPAICRRRHRA
jgi:hypothetical protein